MSQWRVFEVQLPGRPDRTRHFAGYSLALRVPKITWHTCPRQKPGNFPACVSYRNASPIEISPRRLTLIRCLPALQQGKRVERPYEFLGKTQALVNKRRVRFREPLQLIFDGLEIIRYPPSLIK